MNNEVELEEKVSNLLRPLKKSAWIPLIAECDDMYKGSKYFGVPWMPKSKRWPVFDRNKMVFQLQIDLSKLPAEMTDALGIKEGLLQFFRSEKADSFDTRSSLVRIVQPDKEDGEYKEIAEPKPVEMLTPEEMERFKSFSINELRTNPEAIKLKDKLYKNNNKARASTGKKKCQTYRIVSWEKLDDYPHSNEYYEDEEGAAFPDLESALKEIEDEYMDYSLIDEIFDDKDETTLVKYKCSDADKLGGYPYWTQGIETPKVKGEKMELLMQLSGIKGHGALDVYGTGHIFYLPSDPTVLKFVWACT